MANSIQKSGLTVAGFIQKSRRTVVLVFVYTNLYEQVIHCDLYLSQGCILCKAHAKSSNHRWDNATFYSCFCHEISHTITNAHIREKQGFFSQIDEF